MGSRDSFCCFLNKEYFIQILFEISCYIILVALLLGNVIIKRVFNPFLYLDLTFSGLYRNVICEKTDLKKT